MLPLLLAKHICSPESLPDEKKMTFLMLVRYYGFDKEVIREILGRKMSAKLRKDMDDVSEKTGIPLKRCRRQVTFLSKHMLFILLPVFH